MQHILVINCGSSSIKYKVIALPAEKSLVEGQIIGIGQANSESRLTLNNEAGVQKQSKQWQCRDHATAFACVISELQSVMKDQPDLELDAIGHRVVHGGTHFSAPVRLTPAVVKQIAALEHLAPQHMAGNLEGIRLCAEHFNNLPQIAVFDTAFHHNMPEYAYRYPVPRDWFKKYGIRRYGFHGSSHHYVAQKTAKLLGKPLEKINLISLHLGNGDSACAIRDGKSIDTSMGFTPLEGLMMGSRSGDLDAAIPLYLIQQHGLSIEKVAHQLNFESGLQGICDSHDMREIIERSQQGDTDATLALDMFVYHVRKYVGAYLAVLGKVDALVFTGGIGEHAAIIRSRVCEDLRHLGLSLDPQQNQTSEGTQTLISDRTSQIKIIVIAANEELLIAQEVSSYLQ